VEISSNSGVADEPYAVRVASAVLGSFMQQPPDTKTMIRLLTQLLVGMPKPVLMRMVDPRVGVAAANEFFSIAACKKWLDTNLPRVNAAEHKLLPPVEVEKVSPEERERRVQMLKDTAQRIRETVRTNCVGRPAQLEWIKPADQQSEAQKRETARFSRTQAKDRSALLQTDLVKAARTENAA